MDLSAEKLPLSLSAAPLLISCLNRMPCVCIHSDTYRPRHPRSTSQSRTTFTCSTVLNICTTPLSAGLMQRSSGKTQKMSLTESTFRIPVTILGLYSIGPRNTSQVVTTEVTTISYIHIDRPHWTSRVGVDRARNSIEMGKGLLHMLMSDPHVATYVAPGMFNP